MFDFLFRKERNALRKENEEYKYKNDILIKENETLRRKLPSQEKVNEILEENRTLKAKLHSEKEIESIVKAFNNLGKEHEANLELCEGCKNLVQRIRYQKDLDSFEEVFFCKKSYFCSDYESEIEG